MTSKQYPRIAFFNALRDRFKEHVPVGIENRLDCINALIILALDGTTAHFVTCQSRWLSESVPFMHAFSQEECDRILSELSRLALIVPHTVNSSVYVVCESLQDVYRDVEFDYAK